MSKIISLMMVSFLFLSVTMGAYAGGADTFNRKCGSCHSATIDGKTIGSSTMGPDLTGIASTRPADFLRMYIVNPRQARKDYSDIYKKEIKGKYKMKMPPVRLKDDVLDELIESLK